MNFITSLRCETVMEVASGLTLPMSNSGFSIKSFSKLAAEDGATCQRIYCRSHREN